MVTVFSAEAGKGVGIGQWTIPGNMVEELSAFVKSWSWRLYMTDNFCWCQGKSVGKEQTVAGVACTLTNDSSQRVMVDRQLMKNKRAKKKKGSKGRLDLLLIRTKARDMYTLAGLVANV